MAGKIKKVKGLTFFVAVISVIVGLAAGLIAPLYFAESFFTENIYTDEFAPREIRVDNSDDVIDAEISVHFIELGNVYTGDCTLIKTGDVEVLIDCGSRANSVPTVSGYLNNFVTDGIIEYVIVTHAHQDHYAGFATPEKMSSIFDLYECKNIITFSKTNQSKNNTTYKNYQRELNEEIANGAKHYTADDCYNNENGAKRIFDLNAGYRLEILYNRYYFETTSGENNYSVCCMITGNGKNFLFTGDLEEDGEASLAAKYVEDHSLAPDFKVDLYKAGHHGSKTSSTNALLEVFQPRKCCVCCCAGSSEYTANKDNQFPTQAFIDRIAPYTAEVYVTTLCVDYAEKTFESFNGNIVIFVKDGLIGVYCSNNIAPLKDSAWFAANRTRPATWNS